ncbi:hypothetical protein EDB81DRAFT_332589 [Dactylonectria macrodidyma]|uniref:Uncharacterized protein n=1 Tax=Dactylonectria macrodidyma TaxID=307937 RepID=A0A9P9FFL1_9HYPO|nr:hypothetical protein EDB81DRAFT_332589 [Dactylonectria macrodidyma]
MVGQVRGRRKPQIGRPVALSNTDDGGGKGMRNGGIGELENWKNRRHIVVIYGQGTCCDTRAEVMHCIERSRFTRRGALIHLYIERNLGSLHENVNNEEDSSRLCRVSHNRSVPPLSDESVAASSPAHGYMHTQNEFRTYLSVPNQLTLLNVKVITLWMPLGTGMRGGGNARGPSLRFFSFSLQGRVLLVLFFLALDSGLARPPLERNLDFAALGDWNEPELECWTRAERFQSTILGLLGLAA